MPPRGNHFLSVLNENIANTRTLTKINIESNRSKPNCPAKRIKNKTKGATKVSCLKVRTSCPETKRHNQKFFESYVFNRNKISFIWHQDTITFSKITNVYPWRTRTQDLTKQAYLATTYVKSRT